MINKQSISVTTGAVKRLCFGIVFWFFETRLEEFKLYVIGMKYVRDLTSVALTLENSPDKMNVTIYGL